MLEGYCDREFEAVMSHLFSRILPWLSCALAGTVCVMGVVHAEPTAVQSGQDALNDSGGFPWYDGQNDTLRRVQMPDSPSGRGTTTGNAGGGAGGDGSGGGGGGGGGSGFGSMLGGGSTALGSLFRLLSWIVLTVVFLALAVLLIRAFLGIELRDSERPDGEVIGDDQVVDRAEQLPFDLARARGDLMEEARRCYDAGKYGEGIVYLFNYQLVQLDRNQLIRLMRGKTNRQYLREVRFHESLGGLVAQTMVAFEDVFFGDVPMDRKRFEECWQRIDEFHVLVERAVV